MTAARTLRILTHAGRVLTVRVTDPTRRDEQVQDYVVSPIATDFGTAWKWAHVGAGLSCGKAYVADPSAQTCDCTWGRRRQPKQQRCRHLAGIACLQQRGQLK